MNRRKFLKNGLLTSSGVASLPNWNDIFSSLFPGNGPEQNTVPIVDTHFHMWDLSVMDYPWLENNSLLGKDYLLEDYRKATKGLNIQKMVFVECARLPEQRFQEVDWVLDQSEKDPRIQGIVAWLPVDKGEALASDVEKMRSKKKVKGIRSGFNPSLSQYDPFTEGLKLLGANNLSFEINTSVEKNKDKVLKVLESCPDTMFILDHMGNPDIKNNVLKNWSKAMKEISGFSNVYCKVSGVITKASENWRASDLRPYVETGLDAFGTERVVFGGDWPVMLRGGRYQSWVEALQTILKNYGKENSRKLFYYNAHKFYKLS